MTAGYEVSLVVGSHCPQRNLLEAGQLLLLSSAFIHEILPSKTLFAHLIVHYH